MPKEEKFEDALKKLEGIVKKLEDGDLPLEDSLKYFEEGVKLSRYCARKLDEAEKKVEVLMKEKDGSLKSRPMQQDTGSTDEE